MAERYTKKDAQAAYGRLRDALGKRDATSHKDVGGWLLDYAAPYGGYVVREIDNEAGGVSHPFGHERRTAREFWDVVYFALRVLEVSSR